MSTWMGKKGEDGTTELPAEEKITPVTEGGDVDAEKKDRLVSL